MAINPQATSGAKRGRLIVAESPSGRFNCHSRSAQAAPFGAQELGQEVKGMPAAVKRPSRKVVCSISRSAAARSRIRLTHA